MLRELEDHLKLCQTELLFDEAMVPTVSQKQFLANPKPQEQKAFNIHADE